MKRKVKDYLIKVMFIILALSFLSGCINKKDTPYTAEEILQYANDLYHQEFEIISVEEEINNNSSVYYSASYTLSPKDNKDFTFHISSYVKQTRHFDKSAYFGPYEKTIFSHYFNNKMNYHKEEIKELAVSYDKYINEYCDRGYVQEYADLEIISDYFYKANQIYSFTYDKKISNPLSDNSSIPYLCIYKKSTLDESDANAKLIAKLPYSMFDEKLEYDAILKELRNYYIEKVKSGIVEDDSIPEDIYNTSP